MKEFTVEQVRGAARAYVMYCDRCYDIEGITPDFDTWWEEHNKPANKIIEYHLRGFMNFAVVDGGLLIGDTNNSMDFGRLTIELPKGTWSLLSVSVEGVVELKKELDNE